MKQDVWIKLKQKYAMMCKNDNLKKALAVVIVVSEDIGTIKLFMFRIQQHWVETGKSYWGGKLSTVDLLVLTSLDQLIFKLKILFSFHTKKLP